MAHYSLKLVQQKGTASVMLRDGTTVNLSPNKKFVFEIQNPTMEDIKFYRNYRTLGIVFMAESVESGSESKTEAKTETKTETPEDTQSVVQETQSETATTEDTQSTVEDTKSNVEDTTEQEKELMKKTKPELLALAKESNIEIDESLSKQEIVNKLLGK